MIIIDANKKSPKWVEPIRPTFRTELEEIRYLEEEKRRWREGYGDGYSHISGMHYYYLKEVRIKDGSSGEIIRPRYRDCDEWIINDLHEGFWNLTHHCGLVKRREIGATSIGAGLLPSYSMRMFTSSTFGMTSCDQPRIFKAFEDKTDIAISHLDLSIRPSVERKNATKQQVYMKLGWKIKGDDGQPDIRYSDLYAKETSDSDEAAKGFSGTRMRAAYYDEFPLHKRRSKLLNSSRACFMKSADQSGFLFWAGTVEDGITTEQIAELQQLVSDSTILNFKVNFAPAWWGLFLDENGFSDEKRGVEWVLSEREKLDKLDDKSYLKAFVKNYPLTLEEIFELGKGARFEDDVVDKINIQVKNTTAAPAILKPKAHTIIKMGDLVEVNPVSKSPVLILEHPKPTVKYLIGIDGTATSNVTGSEEGSDIAATVFKMFDPNVKDVPSYAPVATYHERPTSFESVYSKLSALIRYYNTYDLGKVMAESNASAEHFGNYLVKEGLERTIMNRRDLSGKGNTNTSKWFTPVNNDIREWQYRQGNIYLRKYAQNIWFVELLREMQKPMSHNADLLDSFLMCLVAAGADFDKPIIKKQTAKVVYKTVLRPDGRFERIKQEIKGVPENTKNT